MTTARRAARLAAERLPAEAAALTPEQVLGLLQRNAQLEAYNAVLMKKCEDFLAKERKLEDALRRSEYAASFDVYAHAACAQCGGLGPERFDDWIPDGQRVGHATVCRVGQAHQAARR